MSNKTEETMRLRNIPGADDIIAASKYTVLDPFTKKGVWKTVFQNENPVYIEIGMGKGQFLVTLARQNPNVNYVGIERYSSVLLRAIQKLDDQEYIPNIKFICMDAEEIESVFEKEEVDKIYLNFSDPWPKDRHAKRRLPSKEYLKRYDKILAKEGNIEFKTDNRALFDFAVEEIEYTNWKIDQITYDLHHEESMNKGNVMTEYEKKVSSIGNPIHKYIIVR